MESNKLTILGCVLIGAAVVFGAVIMVRKDSENQRLSAEASPLAVFAQCVANSGLTMYGAEWCPHCKKEKARFGAAFSYIPYVECPENAKLCLDKKIDGYPTWIDAGGKLYAGEQGLARIAEISGCELPAGFK